MWAANLGILCGKCFTQWKIMHFWRSRDLRRRLLKLSSLLFPLTVREITKSSSTVFATHNSSNILWFLTLHDNFVWNLIFVTEFSSIYLAKGENVCIFDYHLLTRSVRKMVLVRLMQNMDMCLLYKSLQIARLVSCLINHFFKWMFTV